MATGLQGITLYAAPAGEDLTSALFTFATVDTNGNIVQAGSGDNVIGVITEGNTLGNPASVQCDGIAKVKLGGSANGGDAVGPSASPKGEAVTGGSDGVVLKGGDAGDIVSVLLK